MPSLSVPLVEREGEEAGGWLIPFPARVCVLFPPERVRTRARCEVTAHSVRNPRGLSTTGRE